MYTWDFLDNFQNCELRTIVIPGSHDAGLAGQYAESLGVFFVKSMTVTQSEHVGMQALKGSRFFDVRIMLKGKELTFLSLREGLPMAWRQGAELRVDPE